MESVVFRVKDEDSPLMFGTQLFLSDKTDIKKSTLFPIGNSYLISQYGSVQLLKDAVSIKRVTKKNGSNNLFAEIEYLGKTYQLEKQGFNNPV